MAKNDHLNYLELIYYGKDCQNGMRYSDYNKNAKYTMSDKENITNLIIKTFQDSEKEKKNVQSAGDLTERKLSLLGIVGIAQSYLSVNLVLDIKRELYGTKRKLNDLENWELNQLINILRSEYARRKKLHKRNDNKRKKL